MTEQKADYITPRSVTCAKCGATIGECTEHAGRVWLRIGIIALEYAHGACECGQDWHWASSDKTLERMMESRRRLLNRS